MKRILAVLLVYFGVFGTTHPVVAGEVTDAEEKALAELVEAAKAGNPEAQYHIGHALTYQETDANTFSTGIIYLERAAEQGHVLAMHTLAFFFRPGKVPGKTATDAFNWYRRAADIFFRRIGKTHSDKYKISGCDWAIYCTFQDNFRNRDKICLRFLIY